MRTMWLPLAVCTSVAVHIFGVGFEQTSQEPTRDGGQVAGVVALGLGLEDLVQASVEAAPPSLTARVQPEAVHTPTRPQIQPLKSV